MRQADIERFTCGDCHVFAKIVNELTGWPICCFTESGMWPMAHAFVKMPNGKFFDIEGVHTRAKLKKIWGKEYRIRQITFAEIAKSWHTGAEYSHRRARTLAPILLKEVT